MTIQAIETRYAGCRFRSRLEARWAVFFDYMCIAWQYEPQGYLISDFAGEVWSGPYLPDFRVESFPPVCPGPAWIEVKGAPTVEDVRQAAAAAIPHGGLPAPSHMLLLGPFHSDGFAVEELEFHKGDVYWHPAGQPHGGLIVASDSGDFDASIAGQIVEGWSGQADVRRWRNQDVRSAIAAARSARFEHGECG